MSDRDGGGEIYGMNADGSDLVQLTSYPEAWFSMSPSWSPDGMRIAFSQGALITGTEEIHVMYADGSGETRLTDSAGADWVPVWSPDGKQILFASERDANWEIYVMDADGTGATNLTNNPADDNYPSWSPDGTHITFASERDGQYEIYVMNADGSKVTNLTNHPAVDGVPSWSPW